MIKKSILFLSLLAFCLCLFNGCKSDEEEKPNYKRIEKDEPVEGEDYFLPHIDLSIWKVTLPIGSPTEIFPPAIESYATNNTLKPYMFNDSTDGSLVFNNAPPILKLSWQSGKIRVYTKVLKDTTMSDEEALKTESWDDKAISFNKSVNFDEFTLEIIASDGRLEVILNDDEFIVFDDVHIKRWGIFENYFKAGNYLQNKEAGSYANVKYYDLAVSH